MSVSRWGWVLVCVPANMVDGPLNVVTGVVLATTSPIPKLVQGSLLENMKNIIFTYEYFWMCVCTFCWRCEGFIYVSTPPSRYGCYCGFNASLGNVLAE